MNTELDKDFESLEEAVAKACDTIDKLRAFKQEMKNVLSKINKAEEFLRSVNFVEVDSMECAARVGRAQGTLTLARIDLEVALESKSYGDSL